MKTFKNFLIGLDQYLPCDMFTAVVEEFESDKPFIEKVKAFLP